MMVGAAEDVVRTPDYAFSKTEMDKLKLAGLDTIRITQTWTKGQTALGPNDAITLDNAMRPRSSPASVSSSRSIRSVRA